VKRARVPAAVAAALATLVLAAPAAAAFSPPELFVRMQTWDTHEPASDWIPLSSAPALNYLGGYEVGYRLQDSDEPNEFQRAALIVAGVPDGQPTQPYSAQPVCVGQAGAVGTIVAPGSELQFEGTGTYTVTVSVGPGNGGASGCLSGPSTTASFSVDVPVRPELVGTPSTFRTVPLRGEPFIGVRAAAAPPGGTADIRCALDGTVQPDGSITGTAVVPGGDFSHPTVIEDVFTRPGLWRCVARGTVGGLDENFDDMTFATPWSAPLEIDVVSDFRRRTGTLSRTRARRPRFTFVAEWPDVAGGGRGVITLSRVTGCRGKRARLRKVATYRGQFGAKRMRVTMRRPRPGFYVGRFEFGGTRFLRAGTDPAPMLLIAQRRRFGFVDPRGFPRCPGYRP
jgi:hypothetical protein